MSFFKTYQSYIQLLPMFLLTLGCGLDIGALLVAAIVLYLVFCKVYDEPCISSVARSRIFKSSCIVMGVWVLSMLIPLIFNGGELNTIGKYVSRMIPFFLIGIMGKRHAYTLYTMWIGISISVLWYCIDTLCHPNFIDGTGILNGRLMGSFGWPNSLAIVMSLLLPVVLFGAVKYWKKQPVMGVISIFLYVSGLTIILLTGSRNAYIISALVMILVVGLLYACRDWLTLKVVVAGVIVVMASVLLMAPPLVCQRVHQNIGNDGRIYLMEVSKQMFEEHPVVGIGIGNWEKIYTERFELPGREKNMKSPHNIYLQTVNESGLIGLFGFLVLLGFQLRALWKSGFIHCHNQNKKLRWTGGLFLTVMAMLTSGFFDYDFFSRHPMHLYWFYWGMAVFDMYWHDKE
jgi:O-antigen ligase